MEQIESFKVDHRFLKPGVYLSREDMQVVEGTVVRTWDLRFTEPNKEPVMDTAAVHAIEHLAATFFRNEYLAETIYFGPMGCRTGFYLITWGVLEDDFVVDAVKDCMRFILNFEGEIPGSTPEECGNWHDSDLNMAKFYVGRFMKVLESWTEPMKYVRLD